MKPHERRDLPQWLQDEIAAAEELALLEHLIRWGKAALSLAFTIAVALIFLLTINWAAIRLMDLGAQDWTPAAHAPASQ